MAAIYQVSGTINATLGVVGNLITLSKPSGMSLGITIVNGATNALNAFEIDIQNGPSAPWVSFISGSNWTATALPNNVFWASGTPASLANTATAAVHLRIPPATAIRFQSSVATTGGSVGSISVYAVQDVD